MIIRQATEQDWPLIYPIYAAIMAEGKTYPFPEGQSLDEARPWWMEQSPGQTVVAVSDGVIVGSAKMGANRPGRGSHVATASFLVDPARRAQMPRRRAVAGRQRGSGAASVYLDNAPARAEITRVLGLLGTDDPRTLMRTAEPRYDELELNDAGSDELIEAMTRYPELIQRPVVIWADRAIIARPPELLLPLLETGRDPAAP